MCVCRASQRSVAPALALDPLTGLRVSARAGGVRHQGSNECLARVRGQNSAERLGGVRREYSNETLGKPEAHGHRSLSAPPVRVPAVFPDGSAEQVRAYSGAPAGPQRLRMC